MTLETIEELTSEAARGNRPALEQLLERHLPELTAYVERRAGALVRAHESRSDLVQSVCREILQNAEQFQHPGDGAFRRWLFTTALRKLTHRRDFLHAARRDAGRLQPARAADSDASGDAGPFVDEMTPDHDILLREEMARLEAALERLHPDYVEVIRLSRIEGLGRAEVAEKLQKSQGSVRMLLHRALAALAVELRTPPPRTEP